MPPQVFTRPPGFYDRTPQESAEASALLARLQGVLARFGYQPVETPLIEYADLFLTKSGDDAMNRLFSFELYGRLLCLRSEFTPSAARLYVERFQHEPKPIRWQFAGPVFRYESPQRGHSRQFTMLGTELIGSSGIGGDAETIGAAAAGLFALNLREWTLHIGHVGLIGALLDQFGLERRTRRFLLGQVENLRRRGRAYVETEVEKLYAGLPAQLEVATPSASPDGMSRTLELLLASADLGALGAGRTSEDIARRLLNKQRRASEREAVARGLDFLERLAAVEGPADRAFAALQNILPDDPAVRATASAFRATVDLLAAYGIAPAQINIQMGLARGLNYYTGIVFEAHAGAEEGGTNQLFGGGRYDDFIRVIGAAQDTPAVGFAYGLERVLQELQRDGQNTPRGEAAALVVPVDDLDDAEAARVAMALRAESPVELYTPPTRNLSQVLARASKRGTPFVVIIGGTERASGALTVRDMRAGTQFAASLDEVKRLVREVSR